MSDNTTLDVMSGGDTIATDDIGGVKYQRMKVAFGVDGAAVDASSTNPLPMVAGGTAFNMVGASSTATLGTGGSYLNHLTIIPLTVNAGQVLLRDWGAASSGTTVFAGGSSSVATLAPFAVPIMARCTANWQVVTSTNVIAFAAGNFL